MPTIEASFTNPEIVRIDRPGASWFLAGVTEVAPADIDRLIADEDGGAFCRTHGDALLVRIRTGDAASVTMWRALFSSHELFYGTSSNGDVIVSDQFRNVLAALPVADRTVSDLILAGHYLSRRVYGSDTYLERVTQLGQTLEVTIDPRTGSIDTRQFDRLDTSATESRTKDQYLEIIERALVESVAGVEDRTSTALLFSGGVDSTLVLTLKPEDIQPITFVPDTPEFGVETGYARSSAKLLGVDIKEVPVPEASFVEMLESTTETLGMPAFDDSNPYFHRLVTQEPFSTFVVGLGADSAFGMSLRMARVSNWLRFTPSRQVITAAAPRAPGHLGYRLGQISSRANGLAKDPFDPDGFAGQGRSNGDSSLVEGILGPDVMRQVRVNQLAYVTERVEGVGQNPSRFLSHIELSQWMIVFANAIAMTRMMTSSRGRVAVCPYEDWRVLQALASIPLEDRYIAGLRAKWILKELLHQRVPDYPIDQRKKATALPWMRFYTNGPLTDIWDRYDVPELFTGDARQSVMTNPTITTWNAITWAVWDERVRRNAQVQPHPAVEGLSVGLL